MLVLLAIGLSACGSSQAPGVQAAPSAGTTQAAVTSAATPTTTASSTPTTPAISTPKPPSPLSKKPTVTVPGGPAPKRLVVKDLIKGTGPVAKKGSNLTVNYVGVLYKGGKEFDSSWKRSQTFPFVLGQGSVIPGWDQGLVGMKVGGRRELIIPSSLAYGSSGSGGIPPNSPLVFVVDLLGAA
ncbi:MAG: FKBP-type peptidyl-prolyl cis-trans isomerase [Solirubrobacteraceae bacterium]